MEPTWLTATHDALSARQMHDLLRLRHRVFVREQDCPAYDDLDGLDVADDTVHVLAVLGDEVAGYARVLAPGPGLDSAGPRIGRVVVTGSARGSGLGRELVRRSLFACDERWPGRVVVLSAQAHLVALYEAFGFRSTGGVYADADGLPHVDMARAAGADPSPA